jgi:hypothetical protein
MIAEREFRRMRGPLFGRAGNDTLQATITEAALAAA